VQVVQIGVAQLFEAKLTRLCNRLCSVAKRVVQLCRRIYIYATQHNPHSTTHNVGDTIKPVTYSIMNNKELNRIREIFQKLKDAYPFIRSGDSDQQRRIVDALQPLIDEAETLGVAKGFCEAILFWGKEFLDFEFGHNDPPKAKRDEPSQDVINAQRVFGVKATLMTFGEREAAEIAKRKGAIAYQIKGYTQKEKDKDGRPTGKFTPDVEILLSKKSSKNS